MSEKIDLRGIMDKVDLDKAPIETTQKVEIPLDDDYNLDEELKAELGMVVPKKEKEDKESGIKLSVINPEMSDDIQEYLNEMDMQIEETKAEIKELEEAVEKKNESDEIEIDEDGDIDTFKSKYEEAVIVIDKTGMGALINFTDEEKEKLEKVKKIKVEEVEVIELKSLKRKKAKKGNIDKILKKTNTVQTTQVVLPVSGFIVTLSGCSTYELMTLLNNDDNIVMSQNAKWGLLHSKIVDTSIGKLDFNTFLNSVAHVEYDMLVYGVLCATYPEDDTFPLTCHKCKKSFEHPYSVRGLLRAENMKDKLREAIIATVDASTNLERAKECFDNAILNQTFAYELPESGIVFELSAQTAHGFINDSVANIEKLDAKYGQAGILSSAVSTVLIPDPEDDSYFEITDTKEKIEVIYKLKDNDLKILGMKIMEILADMTFDFGLMDITCPNNKCKEHTNTAPVDIESILFQKYQQAMSTQVK